jgi:hypothetical protein
MQQKLEQLKKDFKNQLKETNNLENLEKAFLGKK